MQDHLIFELKEFSTQAAQVVKFHAESEIPNSLLEHFHKLLERRICLDLFIGNSIPDSGGEEPYYLYKIISLAKAGANVFRGAHFKGSDSVFCQIDFDKIYSGNISSGETSLLEASDERSQVYIDHFKQNDRTEDEFRREPGDINVSFGTESKMSLKNSIVRIHWNVQNADKIEIDGIGVVEASGMKQLRISENQVINLFASNAHSKKIKSVFIPVVERPKIFYEVQFLNPSSKEFVSLPEESGLGVFGVSKGNKVRVQWEVRNAQTVSIEPFGSNEHSGEIEFLPEGQFELTIRAILQDTTETQRILIQEFPVPIFMEELAEVKPEFLAEELFQLRDARQSAYSFLDKVGALDYSDHSVFNKQASEANRKLENLLNSPGFGQFYKKYSVLRLNRSIADRIKNYFRNEPSVHELLKSIEKYYE